MTAESRKNVGKESVERQEAPLPMDEFGPEFRARIDRAQRWGLDMPKREVTIKTLVQSFQEDFEQPAIDADDELAVMLNDGWEIIDVTVNSILEVNDDVEQVWHYRIVTMKWVALRVDFEDQS